MPHGPRHEDEGGGLLGTIADVFSPAGTLADLALGPAEALLGPVRRRGESREDFEARGGDAGGGGSFGPEDLGEGSFEGHIAAEDLIRKVFTDVFSTDADVALTPEQFNNLVTEVENSEAAGISREVVATNIVARFRDQFSDNPFSTAPGLDVPTTDGGGGLTAAQIDEAFGIQNNTIAQFGADGRVEVVSTTGGKPIATYQLDPSSGLYFPVFSEDESGTSAASRARDARAIFEDQRDFSEDVFRDRRDTAEGVRRFDLGFGEEQTQNRLSEGRLNRSDVGSLGVALAELNLRQQQHVAQILREPADFLARAFAQRGGESPFAEVTQADLINQLRAEFDRIRDFTAEQLGLNSQALADVAPALSNDAAEAVGQTLAPDPGAPIQSPLVQPRQQTTAPASPLTTSPLEGAHRDAAGFEDEQNLGLDTAPNPFTTQVIGFDEELEMGAAPARSAPAPTPEPTRSSGQTDEEAMGFFAEGTKGSVTTRFSLVGEKGPELLINHEDGSFDIATAEDLEQLVDLGGERRKKNDAVQAFAEGTLSDLTADDIGRLNLFDAAAPPTTTNEELEASAQLATPPGPAAVLSGSSIPDLDVAGGSDFELFSPQQFEALTPDEQVALKTRLASQNRSLTDFLFASNRFFRGTPRRRPRAVLDVTR